MTTNVVVICVFIRNKNTNNIGVFITNKRSHILTHTRPRKELTWVVSSEGSAGAARVQRDDERFVSRGMVVRGR
jgi:hypothetical protein